MTTTEQLAQALRECAEAAWHKDSHLVHFDSTVAFGPNYNFCGLDGIQREEFHGEHDCIVWPCGSGRKWSAYCTYQGSMWFDRFDTVEEAKAVCMELLAKVSPNDPFVKARAVLATHEAEKAAQSAVPGWCPGCTPDNCQGCGVVGGQDLSRKTAPAAPVAAPPAPAGYMNAGQLFELRQGRLPWAYLYREKGVGSSVPVFTGEAPAAAPASASEAPVAAPLTDELTGKLMRIHAALGKMGKKYGEIGSRDVDVARWNADLYEAIAAVGDVLAGQPLEQLARIKLEGGQG